MARIPQSLFSVSVVLVYIQEFWFSECIIIELTKTQAVIGKRPLNLECKFSGENTTEVKQVTISRRTETEFDYHPLVVYSTGSQPAFVEKELAKRINLESDKYFLRLIFTEVLCSDEATYKCEVSYTSENKLLTEFETAELDLIGLPQKPKSMKVVPDKSVFSEDEAVTITCFTNVGRPPSWFVFLLVHQNGTQTNISHQTVQETTYLSKGRYPCTYEQKSSLSLYLRNINNAVRFRCKIFNPDFPGRTYVEGCDDMCLETQPLVVTDIHSAKRVHLSHHRYESAVETFLGPWQHLEKKDGYNSLTIIVLTVITASALIVNTLTYFIYHTHNVVDSDKEQKDTKLGIVSTDKLLHDPFSKAGGSKQRQSIGR